MNVWKITKIASTEKNDRDMNNNAEKRNDVVNASSATTANVITDENGTKMKKCNICNEYKNNKGFSKRQYNRLPALIRVCLSELCQEKLEQKQKLQREREASPKYYMDKE